MSAVVHAINLKSVITKAVIGIVLGLIMLFVPISTLAQLIIVIVGLMMITINGYKAYLDFQTKKDSDNEMLFNVLGAFLGFILLCFSSTVVTIIVAVYLIGLPIFDLYKVKFNKNAVLEKLPMLILGTILLVSGISTFDPIFKVLGVIVFLVSLGYLGYNYYLYKKSGVKIIK